MQDPTPFDLERFLSHAPEAGAFDDDPVVERLLRLAYAGDGEERWNLRDPVDTTTKCFAVANRLAIRALAARVERVEARAEVVAAARQRWRFLARSRRDLVFSNDAGDLGRLPELLARVLAAGGRLDAELEEEGHDVRFVRGAETLARVPKSLLLQLRDLLATVPWESRNSRPERSRSQDSRSIPTQEEARDG